VEIDQLTAGGRGYDGVRAAEGGREADQTPDTGRPKYLFVRILEACNANCFMCGFARSKDRYRFSVEDLEAMLPEASSLGVEIVRFTGGEPLLHSEILRLVETVNRFGMFCSVITNGFLLPRLARNLASAGLAQVIVSIDGATASTHDTYRDTPGLFARCVEGLQLMREYGVRTRVNTVVGPHNYEQIPELQALLAYLGVESWELSALKLPGGEGYDDPSAVLRVGTQVYSGNPRPLGKPWYGATLEEQALYFGHNVPPRASAPTCHVVDDVIYVDGRNGAVFPCSLLPHRDDLDPGALGPVMVEIRSRGSLLTRRFLELQSTYRSAGPMRCTGCSATAAGYSDDVELSRRADRWAY
jgi:cytosylglucuronate decarboxylase